MYTCICMHIYIHVYTYLYTYVFVWQINPRQQAFSHAHTHTHTHTFTHKHKASEGAHYNSTLFSQNDPFVPHISNQIFFGMEYSTAQSVNMFTQVSTTTNLRRKEKKGGRKKRGKKRKTSSHSMSLPSLSRRSFSLNPAMFRIFFLVALFRVLVRRSKCCCKRKKKQLFRKKKLWCREKLLNIK